MAFSSSLAFRGTGWRDSMASFHCGARPHYAASKWRGPANWRTESRRAPERFESRLTFPPLEPSAVSHQSYFFLGPLGLETSRYRPTARLAAIPKWFSRAGREFRCAQACDPRSYARTRPRVVVGLTIRGRGATVPLWTEWIETAWSGDSAVTRIR